MAEVPPTASGIAEEPEVVSAPMDVDGDETADLALDAEGKIEILKGYETDLSAATYCLHEEDHTLGNALRFMLMKNPAVEFCGYSNPHPSEPKIHLRIQMYDRKSSLSALRESLDNLEQMFDAIGTAYKEDLDRGVYERFVDPGMTEEQMRETVKKGEEIRREQREEKTKATAASSSGRAA